MILADEKIYIIKMLGICFIIGGWGRDMLIFIDESDKDAKRD